MDLSDTPAASALPSHIGKYRVQSLLGEGATSQVYLAHDDFADRAVAIKLVRPALQGEGADSARWQQRFFASEAALVGRLKHPNVVQIYDAVDATATEQPYLVMEYVPGTTLRTYGRADRLLPLAQVVEIGFKCAMALDFVARLGVIHRDVKPANILAVTDAEGAVVDVKLTDFGSALNLRADHTQIFRVGSLAYMSPEQLDGDTLDARSDMYALAAVLYQLCCGRPPHNATAQPALMHQIYHAEPPDLASLRQGLPARLDAVLRRALAKSPGQRYPDWQAFAADWAALVAQGEVPRAGLSEVLDSERFNLLRGLEFFKEFDDVTLWEVVHRAQWSRLRFGHSLYRRGQLGNSFHIIASGEVEVFRNGQKVATLGTGTSVGEMAYLAPSPELSRHAADVVVSAAATTVSFTPESLGLLSAATRHHFDRAFIRVLVRRLHAAHESLAHPRRIL